MDKALRMGFDFLPNRGDEGSASPFVARLPRLPKSVIEIEFNSARLGFMDPPHPICRQRSQLTNDLGVLVSAQRFKRCDRVIEQHIIITFTLFTHEAALQAS